LMTQTTTATSIVMGLALRPTQNCKVTENPSEGVVHASCVASYCQNTPKRRQKQRIPAIRQAEYGWDGVYAHLGMFFNSSQPHPPDHAEK
jgi:hypothetical protein